MTVLTFTQGLTVNSALLGLDNAELLQQRPIIIRNRGQFLRDMRTHVRIWSLARSASIEPCGSYFLTMDPKSDSLRVRFGPCVDGSELARDFFTSAALVGAAMCSAFDAVHVTAGHNALRGSGPDQKLAFDNALARVGCPDRRIDRLCITCCSPSQPSHHAGCPV